MRLAVPVLLLAASPAFSQMRFVERTPLPRNPPAHTMDRAGNAHRIAPWAIPSVTRFEAGGYVGGGHSLFAKGPVSTGPGTEGTFGWDSGGLTLRTSRLFLAPSADPSAGTVIARNYRSDGPRLPDVFALRPFRKAVLEKKEVVEERKRGEHEN